MSRARHATLAKGGRIEPYSVGAKKIASDQARAKGGRVGPPMMPEGKLPKRRLDRPGRARGGAVGSDTRPLTSAARTEGGPSGKVREDREDD